MFSIYFSDVPSDFEDNEAEEESDEGVAGPPGYELMISKLCYFVVSCIHFLRGKGLIIY